MQSAGFRLKTNTGQIITIGSYERNPLAGGLIGSSAILGRGKRAVLLILYKTHATP